MQPFEHIIGNAIRVEYEEFTDRLCLVFEITDPKTKQEIRTDWTKDIEFRIVDRKLVKEK